MLRLLLDNSSSDMTFTMSPVQNSSVTPNSQGQNHHFKIFPCLTPKQLTTFCFPSRLLSLLFLFPLSLKMYLTYSRLLCTIPQLTWLFVFIYLYPHSSRPFPPVFSFFMKTSEGQIFTQQLLFMELVKFYYFSGHFEGSTYKRNVDFVITGVQV